MTPSRLARLSLLAAVLMVAACDTAVAVPTDPPLSSPTATDTAPGPEGSPTAEPTNVVEAVLRGDWRRVPTDPRESEAVSIVDAVCRAAEPKIGSLPRALIDARGRGRLLYVYAADPTSAAWECRASLDATAAAEVEVTALQPSGEPIAEDEIDVLHYEALQLGDEAGIVLVGRVGTLGVKIIAGFDDETYIYGSKGGGWYAMWWPGPDATAGVASTDTHNQVIGEAVPVLP